MKTLKTLGKPLTKTAQRSIHGGRDLFIGSRCYTTLSRCEEAAQSAIANGANPFATDCYSCTTDFGTSGWQVRIYG